jgi:hypothetical protein
VTLFQGASGAKWDAGHGTLLLRKQYPGSKTFSVQGVGDQALGISATGKSGKTSYTFVFVVFTRGPYLGGTGIVFAGGTASKSDAVHYASIIDGRIKNG